MSGFPKISRTFLPSTPLEPPRAQIVQSIAMSKSNGLGLRRDRSPQSNQDPATPARCAGRSTRGRQRSNRHAEFTFTASACLSSDKKLATICFTYSSKYVLADRRRRTHFRHGSPPIERSRKMGNKSVWYRCRPTTLHGSPRARLISKGNRQRSQGKLECASRGTGDSVSTI